MLNYYNELKNDILEVLEDKYSDEYLYLQENKDLPKDDIFDYLYDALLINDSVTGNLSGSYYFSSYKSREHCYEFFRNVEEALEEFGYNIVLQKFKTFVRLTEEGYLDIENMTLKDKDDDYGYEDLLYSFEEIEDLNFETIDVITRCHELSVVLSDVLDNYLD